MSDQINGALSPEEKPIIENIISLFQQLLSLQGEASAEPPAGEIVEMAEDEEMDVNKPVDVEKATTSVETGDSNAEERLAGQTDVTDSSLAELKKTLGVLQNLAGQKKKVQKSVSSNNIILEEIRKLKKDISTVLQENKNQEILNKQLFDALGFSDEIIQKSLPNTQENPDNKSKPIQNMDTTAVVKDILTEVFKNIPALSKNPEYRNTFNDKKVARKNLRNIAEYIHTKKR